MSIRTILVVVFALVFGGTAAVGVHAGLGRNKSNQKNLSTIVVATANIPRGETITAGSIVARPYPKDLLPAGVLTRVDDAIGRAAFAPMVKDEPVIEGKLAPKGAGRGLAALIKKGMRAITVQTPNVATGVAGFIVPGNKVDVLMTYNEQPRDGQPGGGTITLLENVEILAVDQNVDAPAENRVDAAKMRSVTLLVTPEEAAKLTLGQNKGTIHLSLRSSTDTAKAPTPPAVVADLYPRKPVEKAPEPVALPKPPQEPPPPQTTIRTIRTIRGKQEGTIRLELGQGAAPAKRASGPS